MSKFLVLGAMVAIGLVACDSKPAAMAMPEVNNENCTIEKIKRLEPEELRQEFGMKCSSRSTNPTTLPSDLKRW